MNEGTPESKLIGAVIVLVIIGFIGYCLAGGMGAVILIAAGIYLIAQS